MLETMQKQIEKEYLRQGMDLELPVSVTTQSHNEAIGDVVDSQFAIRRGKEVMVLAQVGQSYGQAFTDVTVDWKGTMRQVFELKPSTTYERAIVVAALNAVAKHLKLCEKNIHCKDKEPLQCGENLVEYLKDNVDDIQRKKILLIGLQPAFLANLTASFDLDHIRVLDLDVAQIGSYKNGVLIRDGKQELDSCLDWADFVLLTGSTIVNGSLVKLLQKINQRGLSYQVFGNTITAAAKCLSLPHYCPYARSEVSKKL
jgi:uncharacterized protein (DUF4213/DUF364 family)